MEFEPGSRPTQAFRFGIADAKESEHTTLGAYEFDKPLQHGSAFRSMKPSREQLAHLAAGPQAQPDIM